MKIIVLAGFILPLIIACGGGGGGSSSGVTAETGSSPDTTADTATPVSDVPAADTDQDIQPSVLIALRRETPMLTTQTEAVVEATATRSADITVPDGFNLNSEQRFKLTVSHHHPNTAAYLSVCTNYRLADDGSIDIDYGSCVLRTSLSDKPYQTRITITNDVATLVAALWFVDAAIEPVFVSWVLDGNGMDNKDLHPL